MLYTLCWAKSSKFIRVLTGSFCSFICLVSLFSLLAGSPPLPFLLLYAFLCMWHVEPWFPAEIYGRTAIWWWVLTCFVGILVCNHMGTEQISCVWDNWCTLPLTWIWISFQLHENIGSSIYHRFIAVFTKNYLCKCYSSVTVITLRYAFVLEWLDYCLCTYMHPPPSFILLRDRDGGRGEITLLAKLGSIKINDSGNPC